MGNRALRKQAAAAMKAAGFSKRFCYGGSKRFMYRYCNAGYLRELVYMLSLKPGTIVNDCDAFNHRVKKPLGYFHRWDKGFHKFVLDQLEFEDGRWSCGCPGGPGPALTREQIEKYTRDGFTDESIANSKRDGWWTDNSQKMYEALIKEGRHICDEDGIKFPEFCGEIVYWPAEKNDVPTNTTIA
jgi:hypothetical protein